VVHWIDKLALRLGGQAMWTKGEVRFGTVRVFDARAISNLYFKIYGAIISGQ
jgi:hypothetical protein